MATAVKTTKAHDHADKKSPNKITRSQASTSVTGRPSTDPAGPTGRLATWLADVTLDDVPASVREHAKHLLLDGVACALVGAQLPVSRKGVEAITTLDDAGSAELIGWDGLSTSAPSAAMLTGEVGTNLGLSRFQGWSIPAQASMPGTAIPLLEARAVRQLHTIPIFIGA